MRYIPGSCKVLAHDVGCSKRVAKMVFEYHIERGGEPGVFRNKRQAERIAQHMKGKLTLQEQEA